MRPFALTAVILLTLVAFGGCIEIFGGGSAAYEPRTVELTLIVGSSMSDTVPVYTMNDNESQMRIVATPFMLPGQQEAMVPGPEIRLKEGDTLILHLENHNPMPHTLHLHGGLVPWAMDGVPFMTQEPVHQGETFTYVFEDLKAGTYFYHCHVDAAHHMDLGMYGAFIVEEVDPKHDADQDIVLMLDSFDNCHVHGNLDPVQNTQHNAAVFERQECLQRLSQDTLAQNQQANQAVQQLCATDPPEPLYSQLGCDEHMRPPPGTEPREWWPETHPVYAPQYNTYVINGKSFPDTKPIIVEEGQTIRLRLINVGNELHSMHIHGHNMLVTHRDGYRLESPFRVDTLGISPGERYDAIIRMDNPGFWGFHDHVNLHAMNDHQDPGGMKTCIAYDGFHGVDASGWQRAIECMWAARAIFAGQDGHAGHVAADGPGTAGGPAAADGTTALEATGPEATASQPTLPTKTHTGRGHGDAFLE